MTDTQQDSVHVLQPVRDPRFYILMRTDMASMNAGKAMAQAAHAASELHERVHADGTTLAVRQMFGQWKEDRDFGVTYTLGVPNEYELTRAVEACQTLTDTIAGVVHDPTYPLVDGGVVHLLPVNSCGWAFGDGNSLKWYMSRFQLHP